MTNFYRRNLKLNYNQLNITIREFIAYESDWFLAKLIQQTALSGDWLRYIVNYLMRWYRRITAVMILLIFYLFLALFISFLCSIMESVLLSTTLPFLNAKKEHGRNSATLFIKLKSDIEKPLSAILSLNTVAHTIGAAGVGAQATKIFGDAYFGIISAILTLLILVFSEIIPKTIGARYWRQLALPSGIIINYMIIIHIQHTNQFKGLCEVFVIPWANS